MQSKSSRAERPVDTRFQLKRDRMLRAAARCFNLKGYSGTSLKDVANILGLTDAALYYYVRNKEELVYLCYVRAADVGREAMQRAIDEGGRGLVEVSRPVLIARRARVEQIGDEQGDEGHDQQDTFRVSADRLLERKGVNKAGYT